MSVPDSWTVKILTVGVVAVLTVKAMFPAAELRNEFWAEICRALMSASNTKSEWWLKLPEESAVPPMIPIS